MERRLYKVVITSPSSPEVEREILKDIAFVVASDKQILTEDDLLSFAGDAHALCLGSVEPVTRRVIESMPNLRVLSRYGVGVDNIDIKAATEKHVLVTNDPDYCLSEVADHAFTFILALTKHLIKMDRMVREGRWTEVRKAVGPIHAHSVTTLGLLGFGNIPRRVAARARPFGFRLIGYDPWVPRSEFDLLGVERFATLGDFLKSSDIISIHVPLTTQTKHLIGAAELGMMKPSAFIVNTSRGGVIDQRALYETLRAGRIAGAGLDVYETEPVSPEDPILRLDNVILTPHVAAYSEEAVRRVKRNIARSVGDALTGKRPESLVNPEALK